MLLTFQLLGISVAKSWDKTSLAMGMDVVFEQDPALFANILPREERSLLAGLLECKQEECVRCPVRKDGFLMLQRLHLVVTYEDKETWHLYMPDKIRKRLNNMVEEDIKLYPEIEEMHHLLNKISEKREHLYHLLDTNNPETLTKAKAKVLSVDVESIAMFFKEAKPRLKRIEQYLNNNTDTKLDVVWEDIQTTEMFIAIAKATIQSVLHGKGKR